ncbi:hypothetical protein WMY93_005674 [Mugilogobius chulae]|uniref:EGF-like domain-containing protein n=1 Tax=Mugilogobius chulae TaxID=88201 RepID=A0AAW0PKK5_9GOBI
MVQLKACLLLLLLITDTPPALLSNICNEHMNLSQEPTGHISFSPKQRTDQTKTSFLVCTRTLGIPAQHTVQLKLVSLETGSNMSLVCVRDTKQWTLKVGDTALLSGCDRNRAALTWTGAGHSSNAFQFFYYVQEEDTSSTETYPIPQSHPSVSTSNPATTSSKPSLFSETLDPSGISTSNPGLIGPTTPPYDSGSTVREASLFPGEERDNRPDTSGPTDSPQTLDYFNTQHSIRAFQTSQSSQFLQTLSNEATSSDGKFISTGLYTTSHNLQSEESRNSATSSVVTESDNVSSVLRQIPHATDPSEIQYLTENWGSMRTLAAESPKAEGEELIESSSSSHSGHLQGTSGLSEKLFESTKSELQDVASRELNENATVAFNLLNSTQESTKKMTSPRTSSTSLVPNLDTESGQNEAKTTERNDRLTTNFYLDDTTTTTELNTVSTELVSTLSPGISTTSLPTLSSNAKSTQQTIKSTVVNKEVLPKTKIQHLQRQEWTPQFHRLSVSTSAFQIQPWSTLATQRDGKKSASTTESQRMTSWSSEPVHRVTIVTQTSVTSVPVPGSTVRHKPKFYIVPDEPAIIKVESVELLLQITVEDPHSTLTEGLEEDTAHWLEPYLQKAPGFQELLGVWSSGSAVQCLVGFDTSGALQWLTQSGASSLLVRTGLEQAVLEGRSFRSARVTNVTLGGVQEVCGWLLQCPSGFTCVFDSHTSNFSCTSVCHSDYCQHHGLCTHHPAQPPLCRCVAGQDFWFMGQRCEVRMTRARLVLSCLAVLLLLVGLVTGTACVVVRRYRALLIQAKAEQTRSSYRRFNHFDELSGRFWLRSWAGSADSLDNPVFTRSTEILHLRALERPCCYHDDSLSLPSTCPSPGTHIRTIYPHSSQYAWRGSDLSLAEGVVDSGKASDLSVCSWPVEPIQWSPFPLLQQLSRQQAPVVRVSRPRSYCDGMELVDVNKSWTA